MTARARPTGKRSPPPRSFAPASTSSDRWWRVAILLVAGILTYANSLWGPFILDDQSTIADNRQIRQWWDPSSVLMPESDTAIAGRPVVNLSFAVNYAIGGLDVRGFHAGNIALHLACALLVFGIIRRTFELPGLRGRGGAAAGNIAFAVALLWVLHPLNSEVVDYLTERTESLMALFYLLTLYAGIRALSGRRWGWLAVASCALGMACKESMVTAPVVMMAYDRVFVFDSVKRGWTARRALYGALAATWIVLVALMLSGPRSAVGGFSTGVSTWTYLLNQTQIITHYLRLAFWPRALVVFYGWPVTLTVGEVLPYALLIACLLIATVVAWVRAPAIGFLGAWFFITLAPTSSFVPVATEVGAERRMYLPLLALIVLVVVGASWAWHQVARRVPIAKGLAVAAATIVLVAVSGSLAYATMQRNREYASPLLLARTVVERRPTGIAHHILGEQLLLAGAHDEAIAELRTAVAMGDSKAGHQLGIELFNQRRWSEAIGALDAFVRTGGLTYRLVPRWLEPSRGEIADARMALGRALGLERRWPEAAEQARQMLALAPATVQGVTLLADALFAQQRYAEAGTQYRLLLTSRPNDSHALMNLAVCVIAGGNVDEAIMWFRRAVEVDPNNADGRRLFGMALLDHGDAEAAAVQLRAGVALSPNDPSLRELLAQATSSLKGTGKTQK